MIGSPRLSHQNVLLRKKRRKKGVAKLLQPSSSSTTEGRSRSSSRSSILATTSTAFTSAATHATSDNGGGEDSILDGGGRISYHAITGKRLPPDECIIVPELTLDVLRSSLADRSVARDWAWSGTLQRVAAAAARRRCRDAWRSSRRGTRASSWRPGPRASKWTSSGYRHRSRRVPRVGRGSRHERARRLLGC